LVAGQSTPQVTPQVKTVLEAATQAANAEALQRAAGLKDRVHFLKSYLQPLLEQGWLERTIPDKPRSRMQRYKTTEAGLAMATAHASGRPPVSGPLSPDSGRDGGPSRKKKGTVRQ
jgi:hypothetical protein